MARIKVTGYIDTEDLPESYMDLEHPTGLADGAYQAFVTGTQVFPPMEDIEFELED